MMKNCNKKLAVFFASAFGLPVILGIFMGVAFYGGKDVSAFPLTWMCLPASGVMLGSLLCRDESEKAPLPKAFYITFLVMTALLVLVCVAGSFAPINTMLVTNQVVILGSLVCLIELAVLKRERRREWGLSLTVNWKKALAGVGAFIVLYLGLTGLSVLEKGSGRSRGVYRTLSGADRSQRSGIVGDGRRYFILSAESDAVDVGHADRSQRSGIVGDGRRYFILSAESDAVDVGHYGTAAEFCFVVYDVFGGGIWLALLSAACSSGEARASQRRDSPRPFMGNMASSYQFVLLQP